MGWLKTFNLKSIEEGLKYRTSKFGFKLDPIIRGYQKRIVRKAFKEVDLPFIYNSTDMIGSPLRVTNVLSSKQLKKEEAYINKLAKLRSSFAAALEKTKKFRQERLNKRKYTGIDRLMLEGHQFLAGKSVGSITVVKEKDEDEQKEQMDISIKMRASSNKKADSANTKGVASPKGASRKERMIAKKFFDRTIFNDKKDLLINTKKVTQKSQVAKETLRMTKKELKEMQNKLKEEKSEAGPVKPESQATNNNNASNTDKSNKQENVKVDKSSDSQKKEQIKNEIINDINTKI